MKSEENKTCFLIGLGGIGMSALALLLKQRGAEVWGMDHKPSPYLEKLRKKGVRIFEKEQDVLLEDVDEVIYTSALPEGSPLLQEAARRGIPAVKRGDKLSFFMKQAPFSVAVTGAHGKTTTTALTAHLFMDSGRGTEMVLGGIAGNCGSNYCRTGGDVFVAESDESDRTLAGVSGHMAIVTNIEHEHVDRYKSLEDLLEVMKAFLANVSPQGAVFYGEDNPYMEGLLCRALCRKVVICSKKTSDPARVWHRWDPQSLTGEIAREGVFRFAVRAPSLYGAYNIENAAFACACAFESGVSSEDIQRGLDSFRGVARRFEILGSVSSGCRCVSDYAHHPTEIRRVLTFAREVAGAAKVCVAFQPHRLSRLEFFFDDFARSLAMADEIIITEVFAAGEEGDAFLPSQRLVGRMNELCGKKARFCTLADLKDEALRLAPRCGWMLFLGAGTIDEEARKVCRKA